MLMTDFAFNSCSHPVINSSFNTIVYRYYKCHNNLGLYICVAQTGAADDVVSPNRLPPLVTRALAHWSRCSLSTTLPSLTAMAVRTQLRPISKAWKTH